MTDSERVNVSMVRKVPTMVGINEVIVVPPVMLTPDEVSTVAYAICKSDYMYALKRDKVMRESELSLTECDAD